MNKFRRSRTTTDPYSNRRLRIAVLSILFVLVSTAIILSIIAGTRKDDENSDIQTFIQYEDEVARAKINSDQGSCQNSVV